MSKDDKEINQPADYYYKAYFNTFDITHFFHKPKIDKILAMVPEGSEVLDAGCGSGVLLFLMKKKRGCSIHGIDIRPECVEFAKQKCETEEIYCEDIFTLDLGREFDVVTCLDVIEHFTPDKVGTIVSNLGRHVRPGGRLILAFPTGFYIGVVEKAWKVVRKALQPGIKFDDEDIHLVVDIGDVKRRLEDGFTLVDEGLCGQWLIKYLVFEKDS